MEGVSTTGAVEKLIALSVSVFSCAGALFKVSNLGVTGGAGAGVIVDAAGCTCSCRPIEMNDGSGLAGETICEATTGGFTAANGAASTGFSATVLAGGAGAQEMSGADETGGLLMEGAVGSTATGCADLFAVAGPSDGK